MMDLPEGYHQVAVASIDHVGFNAANGEAIIWFTSPEGLKVCMMCDAGGLHRALKAIEENRIGQVQKGGLHAIAGGKA